MSRYYFISLLLLCHGCSSTNCVDESPSSEQRLEIFLAAIEELRQQYPKDELHFFTKTKKEIIGSTVPIAFGTRDSALFYSWLRMEDSQASHKEFDRALALADHPAPQKLMHSGNGTMRRELCISPAFTDELCSRAGVIVLIGNAPWLLDFSYFEHEWEAGDFVCLAIP